MCGKAGSAAAPAARCRNCLRTTWLFAPRSAVYSSTQGLAALRDFDPAYVRSGSKAAVTALQHGRLLHPRLADITDSRVLPVLPVAERLSLQAPATLACSKGSGCNLDIAAWFTTVGPREIGLRSAFRESLDSLLPLVVHPGVGWSESKNAPEPGITRSRDLREEASGVEQ